jgi:hypothetical protein
MRQLVLKTHARTHAAFSLVEVALAMAVTAFGLIAIIGLLPHGVQASRDAADNTMAATILQGTLSQCRSQPFNNILICKQYDAAGNCTDPVTIDLTKVVPTLDLDYDQEGIITNAPSYFNLIVNFDLDPNLPSLARVTAVVSWPARSTGARLNNFTNVTWIAQY